MHPTRPTSAAMRTQRRSHSMSGIPWFTETTARNTITAPASTALSPRAEVSRRERRHRARNSRSSMAASLSGTPRGPSRTPKASMARSAPRINSGMRSGSRGRPVASSLDQAAVPRAA